MRGFVTITTYTRSTSFYVLIRLIFTIIPSIYLTKIHILYTQPILARNHILLHLEIISQYNFKENYQNYSTAVSQILHS